MSEQLQTTGRPAYGLLDRQLIGDTIALLERLANSEIVNLPLVTAFSARLLMDDLKKEINREYATDVR